MNVPDADELSAELRCWSIVRVSASIHREVRQCIAESHEFALPQSA